MRSPFGLLRRRTTDVIVPVEGETVLEPESESPTTTPTAEPPLASANQTMPTTARAPLEEYRGKGGLGRLPQCPECGRFRLQMECNSTNYQFDCVDCLASWSWSVQQPWPRTTATPQLGEDTEAQTRTQTTKNQEM